MLKIIKRRKYNPNYKGLKIMANPDLHEDVMKIVLNKFDKKSKILILGAGSGALDKRLLDKGYKNIASVDINKTKYKVKDKNVLFLKMDLNKENFYKKIKGVFDLIIALEIIEHVYNPYNLLKGMKELLSEKGEVILSTPNIHNFQSKINFLLFGYPTLFIAKPYRYGHVSPILHDVLLHYLELLGLKIKKRYACSNFFKYIVIDTYRGLLWYSLVFILTLVLSLFLVINKIYHKDIDKGLISIYVINKK